MSEEPRLTSDQLASISWAGVMGGGLAAVVAASKAVAVAVETQQLAVDPHLVDAMIKKLTEMQNAIDEVQQNAADLSMDTKLGDGYAEQISQRNRTFGNTAQGTIRDVAKALEELKTQIAKSRASYQNVDQAGADSLKKLDGKQ